MTLGEVAFGQIFGEDSQKCNSTLGEMLCCSNTSSKIARIVIARSNVLNNRALCNFKYSKLKACIVCVLMDKGERCKQEEEIASEVLSNRNMRSAENSCQE